MQYYLNIVYTFESHDRKLRIDFSCKDIVSTKSEAVLRACAAAE
jgi:hypothetical protein